MHNPFWSYKIDKRMVTTLRSYIMNAISYTASKKMDGKIIQLQHELAS